MDYNSRLTIHRLPAEIFTLTFLHAVPPSIQPNGQPQPVTLVHRLSTVCRLWKSVIEGASELWTCITSEDAPLLVAKALRLSSPRPISLATFTSYKGGLEWFFDLVESHIHRCRSLTGSISYDDFLQLSQHRVPELVSLKLDVEDPSGDGSDDESEYVSSLFQEDHPALRHVNLGGRCTHLLWNGGLLTGLERLVLDFNPPPLPNDVPTAPELLGVISNCPNLEILEITLMDEIEPPDLSDIPSSTRVRLPSLDSIVMVAPQYYAASFLSGIDAPALSKFHLSCFPEDDDEQLRDMFVASQPFLHTTASRFPDCSYRLTVDIGRQLVRCGVQRQGPGETDIDGLAFHLEVSNMEEVDQVTRDIVDLLRQSALRIDSTTVSFHWMGWRLLPTHLGAANDLPSVKKVRCIRSSAECLLETLGGGNGVGFEPLDDRWMFAQLEHLELIECTFEPSEVEKMVQMRFGDPTQNEELGRPVRFTKLKIVNMEEDGWRVPTRPGDLTVGKIKGLLGEDCVEWQCALDTSEEAEADGEGC
ncbi:hypothetical protein FRC04_007805 [Tulasnella sp. 424]|nr:hypothetical protein FRC04_007805 [Tulasnella sp. 424]KAG8975281.1 hypothetical protein FRC05_006224 [Tulasnella sp. 425]